MKTIEPDPFGFQIEEGFRDLKSTRFGLGFEQNNSVKPSRLSVLLLLTTLASLAAILLGFAVMAANKHRRFQANTEAKAGNQRGQVRESKGSGSIALGIKGVNQRGQVRLLLN